MTHRYLSSRHSFRAARAAAGLCAACAGVLLLEPSAVAATASWAVPTSGRWLDAANWSPATLPTSSTPVSIATTGTYTISVDNSAVASTITLNNPNATLRIDDSAAPTLTLNSGNVLLSAGTLAIVQQTTATTATPLIVAAGSTLTNNARIDLTGSGGYTSSGNTLPAISVPATTNAGTIEAHDPASGPDAIFRISGSFTNTGSVLTGSHSQLLFTGAAFNQNSGTLAGNFTKSGGTFNYNGGSVSLVSLGSSATLKISPAAHDGTFSLYSYTPFSTAAIDGNIPSGNTVYVPASTFWTAPVGTTNVVNDGHLLIGRSPIVDFGNGATFSLPSADATLTNNGTIDLNSHGGTYSKINGRVVNNGTFNVFKPFNNSASNPARFANNITNNGTFTIESGTYFGNDFGRTFTQNAGTLTTNNALLLDTTDFYFNGGTIASGSAVQLNNCNLHFGPANAASPAQGDVAFVVAAGAPSTRTIDGDIPAGVAVNISYTATALGSLRVVSATNAGTLTTFADLATGNLSGRPVNVILSGGGANPLVNTGTMTGKIHYPSGNTDTGLYASASGNLTNTGTFVTYSFHFGISAFSSTTFNQNAGSLVNNNTFNFVGGTFNYNGGSIIGQPISLKNATLNVAPGVGPASFTFTAITTGPGTVPNTLHGNLSAGSTITLLAGGATNRNTVTADPFTNSGLVTLSPYSTFRITGALNNPGTIDVQTNALLLLDYTTTSPADAVRQQLLTDHLTSSTAPSNSSLGYLDTGTQVQVWLTLIGDANLNGKLDPDDYALLDRAYAKSLASAHWTNGDFNYDGIITSADYLLIDATMGQTQGLSPEFLSMRESQFGSGYVSDLLASVPEPSALVAGLPALLLFRKRRGYPTL